MTRIVTMFLTCAALVMLPPAARGDTLREVEKKIADKIAKYKTIAYNMSTTSNIRTPDMSMKIEAKSTFEAARRGDKWVTRMDSKNKSLRKVGDGKEELEDSRILQVFDGQYSWTLTETPEMKSAMKMKPEPNTMPSPFDAKAMFEMLHKDFDLKLLEDEKIDGKPAYVIEAKPKNKEAQQTMSRSLSYYSKDTGIVLKGVTFDKQGKAITTSTFSDIKVDTNLPADRFVFKAPAGVEVIDMTQAPPTETTQSPQGAPRQQAEPGQTSSGSAAKPQEQPKEKSRGAKGLLDKVKLR